MQLMKSRALLALLALTSSNDLVVELLLVVHAPEEEEAHPQDEHQASRPRPSGLGEVRE